MADRKQPDVPSGASGVVETDTRTEISVGKPGKRRAAGRSRNAGQALNDTIYLSPGCLLTVGRSDACDIIVKDPSISHEHFLFFGEGPDVYLQDLKSRNGTFVNGKVAGRRKLRDGDVITFGESIMTFFRLNPEGVGD